MSLKKIVQSLPLILLLTTSANAGIDSVGINLGSMNIDTTLKSNKGSISNITMPQEQMFQTEIYILLDEVFDDKSWKPTLNFIFSSNTDQKNILPMVGINKYFFFNDFDFYGGALLGAGLMVWDYNPLNNTQNNNYFSLSLEAALQAGVEYKITENLAVGLNTKYYLHDYSTSLTPSAGASSEINQESAFSVSIGLRYSFNQDQYTEEPVQKDKSIEPVLKTEVVTPKVVKKRNQRENWSINLTPSELMSKLNDSYKKEVVKEKVTKKEVVKATIQEVPKTPDSCKLVPEGSEIDESGCATSFPINLHFARKHVTTPKDIHPHIEKLIAYMKANPQVKVKVIAHSSRTVVSNDAYNIKLSKKRAEFIKNQLVKNGIESNRIKTEGKGFHNPIASNDTEEGREKNRRVEINFIK